MAYANTNERDWLDLFKRLVVAYEKSVETTKQMADATQRMANQVANALEEEEEG